MEIGIETGVESVSVPSIFRDVMKKLTEAAGHALVFRDVSKAVITNGVPPDGSTFQDRFRVETITGKNRKVVMGFSLDSVTAISTLKYRVMEYLNSHQIYLRIHTGGFDHGVHTAFLGFQASENPDTADTSQIHADIICNSASSGIEACHTELPAPGRGLTPPRRPIFNLFRLHYRLLRHRLLPSQRLVPPT
jgi:hypothetical protein